jgi:hypothetical protein
MNHVRGLANRLFHLWTAAAIAMTVALLLAREIHYGVVVWPEPIAIALEALLHTALHLIIALAVTARLYFIAAVPMLVLWAWRPAWFVVRDGRRYALKSWLRALVWTGIALNSVVLDLNPLLARAAGLGLIGFMIASRFRKRRLGGVVFCLVFATAVFVAPSGLDIAMLIVLGAAGFVLAFPAARVIEGQDRLVLGVAVTVFCQVASTFIPLLLPAHGGRVITSGMPYGFCEHAGRGMIYAAVTGPGSDADGFPYGRIVELDAATLEVLRDGRPFTSTSGVRGRLVQVLCLPNELQVAMAESLVDGVGQAENVVSLDLGSLEILEPRLFGEAGGQTGVFDPERLRVFYASEWANHIRRFDLEDRSTDASIGTRFLPRDQSHWYFFGWQRFSGSLALGPEIHHARDSYFAGHWLTGSTVYELALDEEKLLGRIETRNGAVTGLNIDEERNRLFVAGLFGVDVFDIETGAPIRRLRTTLFARMPVVDRKAGLVYVSATLGGRIHVFDRDSLDPVGTLAVGYGVRNPMVSETSGALLSGSSSSVLTWNSADLRTRFRITNGAPN